MSFNKKNAFTLAEVLITLGIIGVVAAMTMPNLIAHHKKKVLETGFKKAYSVLSQALTLTAQNLGSGLHQQYLDAPPGYESVEDFSNEFYKHLKTIAKGKEYSYLIGHEMKTYSGHKTELGLGAYPGMIMLTDGSGVSILKNNGFLNILVDTNGLKKPNTVGYDIFLFVVDPNADRFISWNEDANYCSETSQGEYNGRSCTYYAMAGKSPKDSSKKYFESLPK